MISLVLNCIDRLNVYSTAAHFAEFAGEAAAASWKEIVNLLYELLGEAAAAGGRCGAELWGRGAPNRGAVGSYGAELGRCGALWGCGGLNRGAVGQRGALWGREGLDRGAVGHRGALWGREGQSGVLWGRGGLNWGAVGQSGAVWGHMGLSQGAVG